MSFAMPGPAIFSDHLNSGNSDARMWCDRQRIGIRRAEIARVGE
jgi:hypothetical protein